MGEPEYVLPSGIVVGDKVVIKEAKRGPYSRTYGPDVASKSFLVKGEDSVQGRRRLILDETPTALWIGDVKLAYKRQSKDRREHLAAMGVKLD